MDRRECDADRRPLDRDHAVKRQPTNRWFTRRKVGHTTLICSLSFAIIVEPPAKKSAENDHK